MWPKASVREPAPMQFESGERHEAGTRNPERRLFRSADRRRQLQLSAVLKASHERQPLRQVLSPHQASPWKKCKGAKRGKEPPLLFWTRRETTWSETITSCIFFSSSASGETFILRSLSLSFSPSHLKNPFTTASFSRFPPAKLRTFNTFSHQCRAAKPDTIALARQHCFSPFWLRKYAVLTFKRKSELNAKSG